MPPLRLPMGLEFGVVHGFPPLLPQFFPWHVVAFAAVHVDPLWWTSRCRVFDFQIGFVSFDDDVGTFPWAAQLWGHTFLHGGVAYQN